MNLKTSESSSQAPRLVKHVQENGRDVKVFDDQLVVGSITPLADPAEIDPSRNPSLRENKAENTTQLREVYRTWGEDLRGL